MKIELIPEFVVGKLNILDKKERIDLASIIDKSLSDLRKLEEKKEMLKVEIRYVDINCWNKSIKPNQKKYIKGIDIALFYQPLDKFCFVKPMETRYLRIEYKKITRKSSPRIGHWRTYKYENNSYEC